LAALSRSEVALIIFSADFDFLAIRTAISNVFRIEEFTSAFLLAALKALFAVFVTGMGRV